MLLFNFFTADWYLYTSSELNFSILFPTKPNVQSKIIRSELGDIEQTTAFVPNKDSTGVEFQLIISKYNPELFESSEQDSLKQFIISTIISETQSMLKGELIYQNESEVKGVNRSWFLLRYKEHLSLKSCLFWDHENLFCLFSYSDYDKRLSANSERFFNSFTFLSK